MTIMMLIKFNNKCKVSLTIINRMLILMLSMLRMYKLIRWIFKDHNKLSTFSKIIKIMKLGRFKIKINHKNLIHQKYRFKEMSYKQIKLKFINLK